MSEAVYVVVFPAPFSKGRIPRLTANIKNILKIKNQRFKSVRRDGDTILVDAEDPVFASSAIGLLFGIKKIAIARRTRNDFQSVVSEIASVGGNLLLRGEKFLVRVEGTSSGFLPKDVEIAATSEIIEKKSDLGVHPGTEARFDKLLYTYLTKNNAYVCIFLDNGNGGVPYEPQDKKTVCAVYDEISAVSCYETIKQGYDTRIIVCYRRKSELTDLIRHISRIIPRLNRDVADIEFFSLKVGPGGRNYLTFVSCVLGILLRQPEDRISLALPPQVFSSDYIDHLLLQVFSSKKVPIIPLAGADEALFADAREIGIERGPKLAEMVPARSDKIPSIQDIVEDALGTKKLVTVSIGPNNVHDILDSL